ncbi:hypothetical protein L6164_013665 [Bauhinia variegata]|uniref:Uncharacterized protein n=1 Tax=Bauhinia variegata TaxID=167791 RepID=A0ACB9NGK7_BAUVA|nr:hypothetical protein L6164_013665 [Bauhinia variegata]
MPIVVFSNVGLQSGPSTQISQYLYEDRSGSKAGSMKEEHAYSPSRKFLQHSIGTCTSKDISISQSRDTITGIPEYIVQIVNTCVSGCAPHDIHLHCGWFASARIINPRLFKRLSFDDCLVNGGKALATNRIIRFTYSNSFMYPLAFKSAKFCKVQQKRNPNKNNSNP